MRHSRQRSRPVRALMGHQTGEGVAVNVAHAGRGWALSEERQFTPARSAVHRTEIDVVGLLAAPGRASFDLYPAHQFKRHPQYDGRPWLAAVVRAELGSHTKDSEDPTVNNSISFRPQPDSACLTGFVPTPDRKIYGAMIMARLNATVPLGVLCPVPADHQHSQAE